MPATAGLLQVSSNKSNNEILLTALPLPRCLWRLDSQVPVPRFFGPASRPPEAAAETGTAATVAIGPQCLLSATRRRAAQESHAPSHHELPEPGPSRDEPSRRPAHVV